MPAHEIELEIRVGQEIHQSTFRSPSPVLVKTPESVLAASLIPCMIQGVPIRIDEPVSARLLDSLPFVQAMLASWTPKLRVVEVIAEPTVRRSTGDRVGIFLSCGVDSWFSLLRRRDEITDIVFLHGHDIEIENLEARERTARIARSVAAELGKTLIEVESGAKKLPFRRAGWKWANGASLAIVVHLLSWRFRRFYIPSSSSLDHLLPWGSHPYLDPRWSTECLEVIHADAAHSRVDKVREISGESIVLRSLRVCWEIPNNAYNCGRCEKCLRTMLSLHAVGALENCKTFPRTLTPWNVFRGTEAREDTMPYIAENLAALNPSRDRWLRLAIRLAILFAPLKTAARRARSRLHFRSRVRRLFAAVRWRPGSSWW